MAKAKPVKKNPLAVKSAKTDSKVRVVSRSKAVDNKPARPTVTKPTVQTTLNGSSRGQKAGSAAFLPFSAAARYVVGSWRELGQVRWPNRRTTWSLTGAVLIFTAFFMLLIVALDTGFQYIFNEVLLR